MLNIAAPAIHRREPAMRQSLVLFLIFPVLLHAADKAVPPELVAGLKDKDAGVRIKTIKAMSKLGLEAVAPLVRALSDEDTSVSQAATYALGLLRVEPKQLVESLEPHLKDSNVAVRSGVTTALRKGGPAAVPALRLALADKEASVRRQAILSLEVIVARSPAATKAALPALAKAVKDESTTIRVDLARTLSRCGVDALPAVLTLADDSDAKVRAYALAGLARLKPPAARVLPILAKRAKDDPESMVRQSALRTLGSLGKEAVPAVRVALADKDPSVQKVAVRSLVMIGDDAKEAIPALKETAAKAENADVRGAAVTALGKLGKEGEEALLGLLGREDSAVRLACLQYLGKKGKAPKSAVGDLIKALADKEADVRVLSAHVLGLMGADAKEALPALEKARKDADERVGMIAAKAIKQIAR
jgi:HEAT repeat protein